MRLNKKKCIYINMNVKNRIRFKDGTAMPNEDEADYLGAKITKKNLNKKRGRRKGVQSFSDMQQAQTIPEKG